MSFTKELQKFLHKQNIKEPMELNVKFESMEVNGETRTIITYLNLTKWDEQHK